MLLHCILSLSEQRLEKIGPGMAAHIVWRRTQLSTGKVGPGVVLTVAVPRCTNLLIWACYRNVNFKSCVLLIEVRTIHILGLSI